MGYAALIALCSLVIWVYLFAAHGSFWLSRPELRPADPAPVSSAVHVPPPLLPPPPPLPDVDIVVPARDEAETIGRVIASLLDQDYTGNFRVILVDDGSGDGTADLARSVAAARARRATLEVVPGQPKPPGWSGKLWAVGQGIAHSRAPVLLLADADIVHDPRHLSTLVTRLAAPRVDLVSEMVRLNCTSRAERLLVPAFIYFFQMLYPFARVNDPQSTVAAAAGGTVLIRREALLRIGGIQSIRGALIDDVALAKAVKRGGAIYLGHSGLATSIRRYPRVQDLWDMITRTAFTQLRYSAWRLIGTLLGLALLWWVPIAMAIGGGAPWRRGCGVAAFLLSVASYGPTLARYGKSLLWGLLLPLIASFYMAATLSSALEHWRGDGAQWKNRAYGRGN